MPSDRETSLPQDPATSDGPLFREPSGRHATARDDDTLPGDAATDAPGEWVAGNKGPGYSSADDDATTAPAADATTLPPTGASTPADGIPPVDATTPADTTHNGAAPGATGTPVPGAPGTAETTGADAATAALVTNGDQLHADWARIQSSFVDDPRQSVSQAADLVGQVTRALVTSVQEREQMLRGSWDTQDGTDTEHLRNALRDYRAFFELLVKL